MIYNNSVIPRPLIKSEGHVYSGNPVPYFPAFAGTRLDCPNKSGNAIKFDLKAWNEGLHSCLTGITNKRTLENFREVGKYISLRREPPLLIASTLLVPGYIDAEEIRNISGFIASVDPDIPYRLLAFYPHFYMKDLPLLKREEAYELLQIAKSSGLNNVSIGNLHLLV